MSEGSNGVLLSSIGAAEWGQTGAAGGKDQPEEDPKGQGGGATATTGKTSQIRSEMQPQGGTLFKVPLQSSLV